MTRHARMTKSMVYSTIAQGSNGLLMVLMILAGRLLGEEAFGQFSFALAFVSVFLIFTDGGTEPIFLRDVAQDRHRASRLLSALVTWKLTLSSVTVAVIVVAARLTGVSGTKLMLVDLFAITLVLRSLKSGARSLCQAFESFGADAILATIERVGLLVVGLAVLWGGGGVVGLAVVFVVVRVLDVLGTYLWVHRRLAPLRVRWDWPAMWTMQRVALPIGFALILGQVHGELEVLALGWLRSDAEVGWYAAAMRLVQVLSVLPTIIQTVLLPRLSSLSGQGDAHGRLSALAMRIVVGLSLPLAAGLLLAARPLITVIFGAGFGQAAGALEILALALPFAFLNAMIHAVLLSIGRQRAILAVTAGSVAVALTICLAAIPSWGIAGAAVSNLAGHATAAALGLWFLAGKRRSRAKHAEPEAVRAGLVRVSVLKDPGPSMEAGTP